MSHAKREVGAACALFLLFSAEAVTIASSLRRINSFSASSDFLRTAIHSSRDTTSCSDFVAVLMFSFLFVFEKCETAVCLSPAGDSRRLMLRSYAPSTLR